MLPFSTYVITTWYEFATLLRTVTQPTMSRPALSQLLSTFVAMQMAVSLGL